MNKKQREILLLLAGVLFLIILFQNTEVISIKFLFWKVSMSRIILIPLLVSIGFGFGFWVGRKSWDW